MSAVRDFAIGHDVASATVPDSDAARAKVVEVARDHARNVLTNWLGDEAARGGRKLFAEAGKMLYGVDSLSAEARKSSGVAAYVKTLEEAKKITKKVVAEALGGLPPNKMHCSNLGADALQMAIKDYEDRKAGITRPILKRKDEHEHTHGDKCYCPYCDVEIDDGVTFCDACQHDLKEEH